MLQHTFQKQEPCGASKDQLLVGTARVLLKAFQVGLKSSKGADGFSLFRI